MPWVSLHVKLLKQKVQGEKEWKIWPWSWKEKGDKSKTGRKDGLWCTMKREPLKIKFICERQQPDTKWFTQVGLGYGRRLTTGKAMCQPGAPPEGRPGGVQEKISNLILILPSKHSAICRKILIFRSLTAFDWKLLFRDYICTTWFSYYLYR